MGSNAESIAEAFFHPEAWFRGIYAGDQPVGFVMLEDRRLLPVPEPEAPTDFRLYLPASWTQDGDRCKQAGVPEGSRFQTQAALVVTMLKAALAQGYRASCVTADADYGKAPYLRAFLDEYQVRTGQAWYRHFAAGVGPWSGSCHA